MDSKNNEWPPAGGDSDSDCEYNLMYEAWLDYTCDYDYSPCSETRLDHCQDDYTDHDYEDVFNPEYDL